jgi:hypothetical protein
MSKSRIGIDFAFFCLQELAQVLRAESSLTHNVSCPQRSETHFEALWPDVQFMQS